MLSRPRARADGLRVDSVVLDALALDEAIDNNLAEERGGGGDRLGVERVDVLAGGENLGVADGVTAGAGETIVESLDEGAELVILDDLLEAEAEVVEELAGGDDVDVLELGGVEGVAPGHRDGGAAEHVAEGAERVRGEAARGVGRAGDKGADHRAGRLGDVLEELHLGELALVVGAVDALDVVADGLGEELGKRENLLILAVDAGDVDEGGDSLLRGGGAADDVEAAGEEARLDLHQLLVNLTDDHVALVLVEILGVLLLGGELLDVLVEVALDRGGDDGVDDGRAAAGVLQALVGRDELLELLETLVQTGVLGGRVRWDRVGVERRLAMVASEGLLAA